MRGEGLFFGTGGVPRSSKSRSTLDGIERISELGLGCMEVEFVQGVKMGPQSARRAGELAAARGVRLTCHAPYAINLGSLEHEKVAASRERILESARIASLFGGQGVVFHAAFYQGRDPAGVYADVKGALEEITAELRAGDNPAWLRPEVTGKGTQLGSLEEVLRLSAEVEGVAPCIDFAHWHARTGGFNSYDEFASVLGMVEAKLGRRGLDSMHIHLSGIEYGRHGEKRHLNLEESDLRYAELLRALKDFGAAGVIICESPSLEEDALLLQRTYRAIQAGME